MSAGITLDPKLLKTANTAMVLLFAFYIMVFSFGNSLILRDNSHSSIVPYIESTAEKPFIYRTLLPRIAGAVSSIVPDSVQDNVNATVIATTDTDMFRKLLDITGWKNFSATALQHQYIFSITIIALLMYAALVTYGVTLGDLSAAFFPGYRLLPFATSMLGLCALLPFAGWRFQIYDPPGLALSALCLLFMLQQRWLAYMICFTIACFNKETIILQTGLFVVAYYHALPRQKFIHLLGAQLLVYANIMAALHYIYAGSSSLTYFQDSWLILFSGLHDFNKDDMMVLVILCWVLLARWQELPVLLRQSLWIFAGCIAIYYIFGRYREYRVFFDAFPALTVIAGYTLFKPLGKKLA